MGSSRFVSLAIAVGLALASPALTADPKVERDIVFGKGGDVDLVLDLYRPSDPPNGAHGRYPAVLALYGGAWRGGNKQAMEPVALLLARSGFLVAAPQYRLAPKYRFPSQVEDVKCATRWLRAHADEFQVDADHLGAIGFSAGGHLALMLGLLDPMDGLEGTGGNEGVSSRVQAVVNYFGPTHLGLGDWSDEVGAWVADFIGGPLADKRDLYRRASPITYASARDAPILTFHGTRDPLVSYAQAVMLDRTIRDEGGTSELELLRGIGHGWAGADLDRTQMRTIEFFNRHLKPAQSP